MVRLEDTGRGRAVNENSFEGGETLPSSALLEAMKEERATRLHDEMMEFAAVALGDHLSTVRELVGSGTAEDHKRRVSGGHTYSMMGRFSSSGPRMLMRHIAAYAGREESEFFNLLKKEVPITDSLTLHIEYRDGLPMAHKLKPSSDEAASSAERDAERLLEFLAEQDSARPNFRAEIWQQLAKGGDEAFANIALTFQDNYEELLFFINELNCSATSDPYNPAFSKRQAHRAFTEMLYRLPYHYSGDAHESKEDAEGIYFTENGAVERIEIKTSKDGLYVVLKNEDPNDTRDIAEISLVPGVRLDLQHVYYGNSKSDQPFIESRTAAHLLASFEQSGLTPNQRMRDSFMELGQATERWGSGYADLTREVGKLVNDQHRSLQNIFEGDDEGALQRAILMLEDTTDPAAQTVIELLRGVVTREASELDGVVLPASGDRIELKDGSCKDAEAYIAKGQPREEESGEMLFWDSSYHVPSVLTLQPTVLNGVKIPAGSLLARRGEGFLFMRATTFAFAPDYVPKIFGTQHTEYREYRYAGKKIYNTIKQLNN